MDPLKLTESLDSIFANYGRIEKKIHISWKNKNILHTNYSIIQNGIMCLKRLNPDYDFQIYDDYDIEQYLQENLSSQDYSLIQTKKIVEKTDLWRLLKIYLEGGVYCDIDRFCNKSFSHILKKPDTKCILPMWFDTDFSQDLMISCSKNIIHKRAIELNLERRRKDPFHKDLSYFGPITYFHAVTEILVGKQLERDPPKEILQLLRTIIQNSKYLETFREEPDFHTILYEGRPLLNDKEEMYKNQGIQHWLHFTIKDQIVGITFYPEAERLKLTLHANAQYLKTWYIVTHSEDFDTIALVINSNIPKIQLVIYEKKEEAFEFSKTLLHERQCVVIFDSGIRLPENFFERLPKQILRNTCYGVCEIRTYSNKKDFLEAGKSSHLTIDSLQKLFQMYVYDPFAKDSSFEKVGTFDICLRYLESGSVTS
jgi:hypothetical protein